MFGEDIVKGITDIFGKAADKLWMDKDEKAKLEFSKEELIQNVALSVQKLNQDGRLKELELVFQESQAQRDYANKQFGSAEDLKSFAIGKIILFGRASIRWGITGYAMYQTHRVVTAILSDPVIKALGAGTLSTSGIWIVGMVISMVVGIPLFYVAGVSVEKIMKSRGVI